MLVRYSKAYSGDDGDDKKNKTKTTIFIIIGVLAGIGCLSLVFVLICRRLKSKGVQKPKGIPDDSSDLSLDIQIKPKKKKRHD